MSQPLLTLSPDRLIGQQSADQLPWFHIVTLITNFEQWLGTPQAGLAGQILKGPYHFDFLGQVVEQPGDLRRDQLLSFPRRRESSVGRSA